MDAKNIEMTEEEAKKAYDEYSHLVKDREEEHLEILKKCTYHLSQGRKLLNVYDVIKDGGVFENGEPKLAIGRADWGKVVFTKHKGKSGIFADHKVSQNWGGRKEHINLPNDYFENGWEIAEHRDGKVYSWSSPIRECINSPIPIIPAVLTPKGKLNNYYILFEVDEWIEGSGRRMVDVDPLLLRRLSDNMFVVLAVWDVSPLEQAILEGL